MNRGETWQSFETALPPSISANTLSFHANKWDWIIYAGSKCDEQGGWRGRICHAEVRGQLFTRVPQFATNMGTSLQSFYTQDAFASKPKQLLPYTTRCLFAHDKKEFAKYASDQLVYCVASEPPSESSALSSLIGVRVSMKESRLYSSTDFFASDRTFVDLGIGKEARGIVGIGGVSKYLVTALRPNTDAGGSAEMVLYVTEDGKEWSRAMFPHGHGLKENAYTIVESTEHSILVDVNSSPATSNAGTFGTLFTSNSEGTQFVRSLEYTNRNKMGIVDFEKIVSVEGIAIVNTVSNPEAVEAGDEKELKTRITFDDGTEGAITLALTFG